MSELTGRYILGILGCDLAANPIERQHYVARTRDGAKYALTCERPALLVVAVEPGHEDEARDRIRAALDNEAHPGPTVERVLEVMAPYAEPLAPTPSQATIRAWVEHLRQALGGESSS